MVAISTSSQQLWIVIRSVCVCLEKKDAGSEGKCCLCSCQRMGPIPYSFDTLRHRASWRTVWRRSQALQSRTCRSRLDNGWLRVKLRCSIIRGERACLSRINIDCWISLLQGQAKPTQRLYTMLASKLRPSATQFGRFMLPLRTRNYSAATEKTYEHIKVSTPRAGVGLGSSIFYPMQSNTALIDSQSSSTDPKPSMPSSRPSSSNSTPS